MTTKNDLYAYPTWLGVKREFSVITEFGVRLPDRRKKNIDLVWATRRQHPKPLTNTLEEWCIHAAFEIEGSNVRLVPREFRRHLKDFQHVGNLNGEPMQKYVVLYTAAYDRRWNANKNRDEEIRERQAWAAGACFNVLDGSTIEKHANEFPFLKETGPLEAGR